MSSPEQQSGQTEGAQETQSSAPSHGISRRNFILGGLSALGLAAIGEGARRALNKSSDNVLTDPTLKPTEPAPTFTPEPTATPEATSTPEKIRTLEEQLGYKLYPESVIKYEGKYINMHLGVDQDVVDNDQCDDPPFGKVNCLPIEKFYLSSDYVKEKGGIEMTDEQLIAALEDGILTGHLVNLRKNEKYADWTLDDLKERIKRIENGEDLEIPTYKVYGGYNGPAIGMPPGIDVDVTKDVYIHKVHKQALVKLNAGAAYGYKRLDDGSYVEEIWDTSGFSSRKNDIFLYTSVPSHIANGLVLAKYDYLHDGAHHSPGIGPRGGEIVADVKEVFKPMFPVYDIESENVAGVFKVDVK